MPSLAGAVTRLTLAGVPGGPTWTQINFAHSVSDTYVPVLGQVATGASGVAVADTFRPVLTMTVLWVLGKPRPDDGQFTALTLAGVPGRVNVFTDKPAAVVDTRPVVDTYIARLVMGDVTQVQLNLTDDYRLVLGMSATPSQGRTTSDRYVPVLLMPLPNTVKSGTFPKFATDTYVPTLAMLANKRQDSLVVDSYVPRLTMIATMSGAAVRTPVDTYVPVLEMEYSLTTQSGTVDFARSDTYVPVLVMATPRVGSSGDVDHISIYSRPYGVIRIVEE
jgi:hypothetical protein